MVFHSDFRRCILMFRHGFQISAFNTHNNQTPNPKENLDQMATEQQGFSFRSKINSPWLSQQVDDSEIRPGDHIYAWRKGHTYSHHGIFIGDDRVIHVYATGKHTSGSASGFPTHCKKSSYCGYRRPGCTVFHTCVSCFKGDNTLYRYQYGMRPFEHMFKLRGGTSTTAVSDPPEQVIKKAKALLQHGFGKYHLVANNCEDFGIYCKTSLMVRGNSDSIIGTSGQGNSWFRASLAASIVATSASAVIFVKDRKAGKRCKGDRLFRASFTVISLAAAAFFITRHAFDIGVRPDAVRVELKDFLTIDGRKPEKRVPGQKVWCDQCGEWR